MLPFVDFTASFTQIMPGKKEQFKGPSLSSLRGVIFNYTFGFTISWAETVSFKERWSHLLFVPYFGLFSPKNIKNMMNELF